MPTKFSPSTYLKGLGWTGEGTGLTDAPHARSRPVTVAHKKTLSGVGKDRDTAFPWWEAVFSTVATKVGTDKGELHRTKTGILSNKPPPPKADTYVPLFPSATPSASTSGAGTPAAQGEATFADPYASRSALNLEAMAQAKVEMARRQLYSSFIRGKAIANTGAGTDASTSAPTSGTSTPRRKRKAAEADSGSEDEEEKAASKLRRKEQKAMRKALRAKRREARALKRAAKAGSSVVPTPVDSSDSDSEAGLLVEAPSAQQKVKSSKQERRAAKKALKSSSPSSDPEAPSDKAARKAAKAAEKEKKKRKASEDYKSPEEERVEEEAYEAARKVAKEQRRAEKRLRKAVEHSLEGQ